MLKYNPLISMLQSTNTHHFHHNLPKVSLDTIEKRMVTSDSGNMVLMISNVHRRRIQISL